MRKVTLSGADTMSRNVSLDKKVDNIDWLKPDIIGQKRGGFIKIVKKYATCCTKPGII